MNLARLAQFLTITFEFNLGLPAEITYKAYDKRWKSELVMRYYKSVFKFGETRVQDDYSVIGNEFIDFLLTLLTFRLIKEFDKAGLLKRTPTKS